MNKFVYILLTLLLLVPISSATTFDVQYCQNSTTQTTKTMSNTTGVNITTALDFKNCEFGCDSTVGVCKDPNPEFNYGYLVLFAFSIGIFASLYIIKVLHQQEFLQFIFLFSAIILQIGCLFSVGIIGQNYTNSYIMSGSSISFNVGIAVAWIMVFMLFISFITFILKMIDSIGGNKKKRGG
jgi:hypothetical protein